MVKHPIWDIPTRVIHWLFVVGVAVAWWSAEIQRYDIHEWNGYTLLVLVLSRVIWGFVGSRHSRFTDFVRSPRMALRYLLREISNSKTEQDKANVGHNPAGGWSVLLLLLFLSVQAVSGLFNSDDILFSGPFYYAADSNWQGTMGSVHEWAFNGLLALVALHLVAVAYCQWQGPDIVRPMLRGNTNERFASNKPVAVGYWILIVIALSAMLWWLIQQAPQPVSYW